MKPCFKNVYNRPTAVVSGTYPGDDGTSLTTYLSRAIFSRSTSRILNPDRGNPIDSNAINPVKIVLQIQYCGCRTGWLFTSRECCYMDVESLARQKQPRSSIVRLHMVGLLGY